MNTAIIGNGFLLGSIITGILLDLFDNQKIRNCYYVTSGFVGILLYRALLINSTNTNHIFYIKMLLFIIGLLFSLSAIDLIKYARDYFFKHISAMINGIFGSIGLMALTCSILHIKHKSLCLLLLVIYVKLVPLMLVINTLLNSKKEDYEFHHLILVSLAIVLIPILIKSPVYIWIYLVFMSVYLIHALGDVIYAKSISLFHYIFRSIRSFFITDFSIHTDTGEETEKQKNVIQQYFSGLNVIFKDWEFYFYLLFLVTNTFGMQSGFNSLVLKKNIFFVQLGGVFASLLYHYALPKFAMRKVTLFFIVLLNFLIYFQFFGSSIVGHILFGICGASVFLTFIYGLSYEKYLGFVFGLFYLTQFVITLLFNKFAIFCTYGKFLTKDLHIILLQVNKKVILHLYGYHLPLIIFSIITIIFYQLNKNDNKSLE